MKKIFITTNLYSDLKTNNVRLFYEQKLPDFFLKLKYFPIIVHPTNISSIKKYFYDFKPDLLVLSGGNTPSPYENKNFELSKMRDNFEKILIKLFIKENIPILGICRGMQYLNIFFNGTLSKLDNHVGSIHKIYTKKTYEKYFPGKVNTFHNYGITISDISSNFFPLSYDLEGNIEAMIHKKKKIYGIMWHPEREMTLNRKYISFFKNKIFKK